MSLLKKIEIFSSDERGDIMDIFTHEPKDHCTIVTFTRNAVRGNHFHKESVQSAYILEGNFKIYNVLIDKDHKYRSENIHEIEEANLIRKENEAGFFFSTSGTTGAPKYSFYSYHEFDFMTRKLSWASSTKTMCDKRDLLLSRAQDPNIRV